MTGAAASDSEVGRISECSVSVSVMEQDFVGKTMREGIDGCEDHVAEC